MLTYNVACAIFAVTTCGMLCGGYALLSRHAVTNTERYIRYAEIVLICAITCGLLLSISGLTDQLQPV